MEEEAASFVLGDMAGGRRAEVVAHLDSCPACRREVAGLNAILDSISAATAPVAPGPGFVQAVLARADADPTLGAAPAALDGAGEWSAGRLPVTVVMRRRRTLLSLTAAALLLVIAAVGSGSWLLYGLAVAAALLDAAYLSLVIAVTHTRARAELADRRPVDELWWRGAEPVANPAPPFEPAPEAAVVSVDDAALLRFLLSHSTGWLLTPVVAVIWLLRGDLTGPEQSPVLARIVSLQRQGRAQSLRLLAAGATTVAVAGGGTAVTFFTGAGVAAAATPGATYTVHAGDTLSGIAQRYGLPVGYLAQLNGISDPNFVLPGEVIRLGGSGVPAGRASGAAATYTVRAGDTLDVIAARYSTTAEALAGANHIADPNFI